MININDRWHSGSSSSGNGAGGGYRDGFDKEREKMRREIDERGGRELELMNRRPTSNSDYFDQSSGSSRERDKIREYPTLRESGSRDPGRDLGREPLRELTREQGREPARFQRSLSPKFSESIPRRRSTISGEGYSQGPPPAGYWAKMGGIDSASSSSNRLRSISPGGRDYHLEERDIIRGGGESIVRGFNRTVGGGGVRSSSYGQDSRAIFDGHRRLGAVGTGGGGGGVGGVTREDSIGSGSGSGSGIFSSVGSYSRERYSSSFGDLNSERNGTARGGEVRNGEFKVGGRGVWSPPHGLPRGGFFSGKVGLNRFGSSFDSSGRAGFTSFTAGRNFTLQRRGLDEGKKTFQHQQNLDDKDIEKDRSISDGSVRDKDVRSDIAVDTISSGVNSSNIQSSNIISTGGAVALSREIDVEEENDNMDIDTDTLEVMATPVRMKRVITGTSQFGL